MKLNQFKKGDFIIFLTIIVVAITCMIPFRKIQNDNLICEISVDNKIIHSFKLNNNFKQVIEINENKKNCTIIIENNCVWFSKSNCPDKVCIKSGKLTHSNQIVACVPNKVIVKIIGNNDKIDAIVK